APGLTATGLIAGTPAYMSPEQISNFSGVTASADLYALGVVAFEMLTRGVPFHHPDTMNMLMLHLKEPPPSPRSRNPDIPPALEAIILQLLEKDAALRPASCRELAEELKEIRLRLS